MRTLLNYLLLSLAISTSIAQSVSLDLLLGSIKSTAGEEDSASLVQTLEAFSKYQKEKVETFQASDEDATLSVPEIINKYGYPAEIHNITTEDGYILQAHRIPRSSKCGNPDKTKRVVWLQHGLFGDSSNWIITGPNERGLAYQLADKCYDVFMGNFRGTTNSRNHVSLDPNSPEFWNFSLHEVGIYDVPANIDYALDLTGAESLYYIGHSMGTTTFFIALSERPEYASKVELFSALAPVVFMPNTRCAPVRAILPFLENIEPIVPNIEVLPISWTKDIAADVCAADKPTQTTVCTGILYLMGGANPAQMDMKSLPAMLGHAPAGSSAKVMIHYGQAMKSGDFKRFDYRERNMEMYGTPEPPYYDLSKYNVSTAMYWSDNDLLADKRDVLKSIQHFNKGVIVRNYRVEDDLFTHLDFIWALDQQMLINTPVIGFMEEIAKLSSSGSILEGVSVLAWGFVVMIVMTRMIK